MKPHNYKLCLSAVCERQVVYGYRPFSNKIADFCYQLGAGAQLNKELKRTIKSAKLKGDANSSDNPLYAQYLSRITLFSNCLLLRKVCDKTALG